MSATKIWFKRGTFMFLIVFLLMNVVAAFHAYEFTHFSDATDQRTKNPGRLSPVEKIKALVFGVNNPRPMNKKMPENNFKTVTLQSNRKIECWEITKNVQQGTIVLFHGYAGDKSSLLDKAEIFLEMGYGVLLVDFMGSGGSEGKQTTIGYLEAEQVNTCYEYLNQKGEKNIFLFGTSMGAVAIMKAIHDHDLHPAGIIIECPFGSLYSTVCARFESMNAPAFPMAGIFVFWGGAQNGFWAFDHKPVEYAKKIKCPTLLLYGAKDEKVSRAEIDEIFANLRGHKQLKVYAQAGHENYLNKYKKVWTLDVSAFLKKDIPLIGNF